MRGRAVSRPLFAALAISLLAHLGLMGGVGEWWQPGEEDFVFPIEASLSPPPPSTPISPKPEPPRPKPMPKPRVAASVVPPPDPELAEPEAPPEPTPEPVIKPQPESVSLPPVEPTPTPVEPPPASAKPEPPPPPARPVQRDLPERMEIRYQVRAGEDGFILGRAIYTWHRRGGHYSLVSIAEASGLASLFISGRIIQLSEGEIAEAGLRPGQYWLQRKARRQDVARFDWINGRLNLGSEQSGQTLPDGAQDLLGFPFHLALTVRLSEQDFLLPVTNGRKLQDYHFQNLGRETLELGGQTRQALHLQGSRSGEGSLDVWLDIQGTWLPLVIRTLDTKGKVMVLTVESITTGKKEARFPP